MIYKTLCLKKGDPIIRKDKWGEKKGYYQDTVLVKDRNTKKTNIYIRFTQNKSQESGGVYIGKMDSITPLI